MMKKQSNKLFNLTYDDAIKVLNTIVFKSDYTIELSEELNIGNGMSYDSIIEVNMKALIGIKNLKERNKILEFPKTQIVSDKSFIKVLICIFHESRHLELATNKYKDTDKELLYSYMSKQNNPNYYLDNYFKSLIEIDAEYLGILTTCEFIQNNYPDISKTELYELIYDYLDDRCNNKQYFCSNESLTCSFKTISDLTELFENAYSGALRIKKQISLNNTDEISKTLNMDKFSDIALSLLNESNGLIQEKMVSTINIYNHPEYIDVFDIKEGLSLEMVFGISPNKESKDYE